MKKRILSLILAVVTLLTFAVSCGDTTQQSSAGGNNGGTASGKTSKENSVYSEEEQAEIDNLVNGRITELKAEKSDFEGATFTMVGRQGSAFPTEEEITGDKESDCVYERNKAVEANFNIVFDFIQTEIGPEAAAQVMQDVDAGINSINAAFGNIVSTGTLLFSDGYLSQVSDYEQIELENPWWLSTMEKYYAVGDKLFFLSGDILPNFFDNASCVLYNKTVADNYSMTTDLYAEVNGGTWTIDKMFETASVIPGGGEVKRYGDTGSFPGTALLFGAGETITKFDDDNMPYVEETLSSTIDSLAQKVNAQTGDFSYCYNSSLDEMDENVKTIDLFSDNKILYLFASTATVASLREKNVDAFGILPVPKYDAAQSGYITYSDTGNDGSVYLPKNQKDNDFTGTIVEAMGAYSYQKIRPVYYELRLKTQSVYDLASKEMLDIIYDSQVYELYFLYGNGSFESDYGAMFSLLEKAIYTDSESLSSGYASIAKTTALQLKNFKRQVKKYYGE